MQILILKVQYFPNVDVTTFYSETCRELDHLRKVGYFFWMAPIQVIYQQMIKILLCLSITYISNWKES